MSGRPWVYDSNSQSAREESTATRSMMHGALLPSPAPVAVTLSFSPITADENQNHKEAKSRRHNKQSFAENIWIYSRRLPVKQSSGREASNKCFFFFCMSVQQQCAGWINNRGDADDMAQLYLEQPEQSQRVTEAPPYRWATVEGSSSLLLSSSQPLWSPTTVSFITHGTAGVCRGWLHVCHVHTRQREKERVCACVCVFAYLYTEYQN